MAQEPAAPGKKRPKFMDALEQPSCSDSDEDRSGSGSSSSDEEPETLNEEPNSKKQRITFEDLQQKGYTSGPSVMYMKAPQEQQEQDWAWSSGRDKKEEEGSEDDAEERAQTRHAVTEGVQASTEFALKAAAYAQKLREDALAEKQKLAADKRLSFNQKEKKKRDKGQVSRGTNFVEEEKRMMRQYKQYSGFD